MKKSNYLKSVWKDIKTEILKFIHQESFWKKFLFVYTVYFVGILSLIQANYLYKTDISRVAQASYSTANWGHSGRWLNDLFTLIFHFDTYPRDISPLSQILALVALSLASMILVHVICQKTTYMRLFVSVIVGLSPYYLQVLSYIFDCLFYSIGVLIAVIPFLFYKRDKAFYWVSALSILCCYLIFQSTISIYMVVVTYLFLMDYHDGKKLLKNLSKKMFITTGVFCVVSFFYYVLIQLSFPPDVPARTQSALCELTSCWDVFKNNFQRAVSRTFIAQWKGTLMGYAFLAVLCSFFFYQIKVSLKNTSRKQPKIDRVLFTLVMCFLMLFFIVFWTMFFTFIYWNARIWTAFGPCFVVMMLAMSNEKNQKLRKLFMFFSVALTWGCIVFSNRMGNLIEIQKRYESFMLFGLAQDLSQFPTKNVMFNIRTIRSPIVEKSAEKYPLLLDLVTGMQTKYLRFRDYFFGFYRPEFNLCYDKRRVEEKKLLNKLDYSLVQINNTCIEVQFK